MVLSNLKAFIDGKFCENTSIEIIDGKIASIGNLSGGTDMKGAMVIPGLVDIHTHGCMGFDFSSAAPQDINKMREYYLKNGITSILPTTVTLSNENIIKAVKSIKEAKTSNVGSRIMGINLEGPYLSPKKCGAHDICLLKEPDYDFISSLGDEIKIVNVAPEYKNAFDFIEKFHGTTSIAHTACDYDTAMTAIEKGANHITHIFNAMDGIHHRKPGVIGAFFDSDAYSEIICDTIHIHPAILRMMFMSKPERLVIISDSMSATGLSDGKYKLGDLDVFVKDGVASLEDGTLAGSTTNIYKMMKLLIDIGVKPEKVISSLTEIPSKSISIENKIGYIKEGAYADLLILNEDYSIAQIIYNGENINT